ncbi:glucosamine-6-phosphate deaminase [Cellvibrio japonicus]|uniref:Glucosamine-6-phosphate deaminase n=1 Tax=Cellvibrio japonicus (strain Ueda107) TaxID=498211 RepID=NAGB_CELJU|nr:glucosamine-6-phosphate deaminase [Cellvibrio japonicus]B3PBV0.1 RecName: Full=Glucosamine-6-phosphate deaminase; AltName: Full=GlcN6P deaminase; Short=GNPDA; AltName: Full=Glucosamine-6-phosphate isomerase [Cellvibrio japonicus Ueda107]ACE83365.1 glucosamine-6-phosphate isomerase [Cellvibrio japonicus Ueda107]QEI11767.1 glucosamine-6-phosphate deaminase [Cellvibrio japonicus]QEI15341.1 glucosamine-6-phosphate deaminase [Cellvibrio japonicus]QEI18921.1 glucosamine-6-phosphate deaminase [Cel
MKVVILNDAAAVARYGADLFIRQIHKKPDSVLGLATGSTPVALYKELILAYREGRVTFKQVSSFNLDEYLGLDAAHPQSYRYFMNEQLFNHIDIDKAHTLVPPGDAADPIAACALYEKAIAQRGGIDVQLLGIGRNGHIGFNEPSSSLMSRTRVKTLTRATIDDNARFFAPDEYQPHLSITMGIGTILESKKVVLLATGENKADAIKATVEGPLTAACPASALQLHEQAVLIIDEAAASKLSDVEFYKHIERENQKLLDRLGY